MEKSLPKALRVRNIGDFREVGIFRRLAGNGFQFGDIAFLRPQGIAPYRDRRREQGIGKERIRRAAAKIKEENPSFTVQKARDVRLLEKPNFTNMNVQMFDLHKPLSGTQKYTVYTFFDPGENSWMGDVKALPSGMLTTIDQGLFEEGSERPRG